MGRSVSHTIAVAAPGALLGALAALAAAWLSGACNEYGASLLRFSDAGPESAADVQPGQPEAADGQPDTGADADAAEEPAVDSPSEAPADDGGALCSATLVDCDGDEGNGCETDLSSDGQSCGACGHGCLGGSCATGACLPFVLASGQSTPSNVALDGTHLYWTNQVPAGAVMRVPKHGGTPEIVGQFDLPPGGLAVDDSSVFWSEFGSPGSVWRLDKTDIGDAGAPIALASGQGTSTSLAVDSTRVYWTTPSTVRRTLKTGGALETIASNQPTPGGLLASLGWAFWTNVMGGEIVGMDPSTDAGIQVYAQHQDFPAGLAADFGNLYWANYLGDSDGGSPKIMMIARVNMTSPVVLADGQTGPLGIAQLGTHIYWTNNVGGTVMRVLNTGGTPEQLASGQQAPAGIAVDSSAVYWVNRDDGTVMALAL